MRRRCSMWRALVPGVALACVHAGTPAIADDTKSVDVMAADAVAEQPSELSVTVYRAPYRGSGSINLNALGGFALISETRSVRLAAGVTRLRFLGVADGIEPASALVTGLPEGVIEKNREGKLLSPSALVAAALDRPVTLLRTYTKSGKRTRLTGRIRSDAEGGVVFETPEGIEALRCSGLAETFSFTGVGDLSATPTLSVQVQSSEAVTRTVTLSYLARGFDWAADYTATVSADGKTLDLGAWVTLANGNGVGFPAARTQVVAGRVNRENGEVEPLDVGGPILAQCWPRGSTSATPSYLQMAALAAGAGNLRAASPRAQDLAMAEPLLFEVAVAAKRNVEQEQLGDLKLYRVPERTTVASRQSKQVRLLDRTAIPITRLYSADLWADTGAESVPASLLLRTPNTKANHLGLPLPSGRIAVYAMTAGERLLQHESALHDLAVDEELEIDLGPSAAVQVTAEEERTTMDSVGKTQLDARRVKVSNARAAVIPFELRLRLPDGARLVHADHTVGSKNGRPIFRLTIPANGTVTLNYQWQRNRLIP
jgi:hypothetical protein